MRDRAVQITPVAGRAIVQLKVWSHPRAVTDPAHTPMTSLVPSGLGGQVRVLAFAPGEWLAISDTLEGSRLCERLNEHINSHDIAITDVNCALKVMRVEGPAARGLLERGCGLDLNPQAFGAGHCVRTRFAQLPVVLQSIHPQERFELYVGRSYLAYLESWLDEVASGLSR
jgi:sarcosine oxidase subunit gamma